MFEPSRWTWKRWTFLAMVTASVIYLTVIFGGFLRDADTSFSAATQLSDNSLSSMIVHRRPFTPPRDSSIRVANVHLMERVVHGLDTMRADAENITWSRRKFLADLFNSYSTSIEEYRWVRRQTIRTLRLGVQGGNYSVIHASSRIADWLKQPENPPHVSVADSLNIHRLRMSAPFLIKHAMPLIRNDDSEALK